MKIDFDLIWATYPRKAAKAFARKVWAKLNPTSELAQKILGAIQSWKESGVWEDQRYIPHLATWLNGERWEDELPAKKKENNVLDLTKRK